MNNSFQERNKKILKEVLKGRTLASVGEELNLTRERISQIVKELEGERLRDLEGMPEEVKVDWRRLNDLRRRLNISHGEISFTIGHHVDSVRHVFTGNKRYTQGQVAVDVLKCFLMLVEDIMEDAEQVPNCVEVRGCGQNCGNCDNILC